MCSFTLSKKKYGLLFKSISKNDKFKLPFDPERFCKKKTYFARFSDVPDFLSTVYIHISFLVFNIFNSFEKLKRK